MAGAAEANPRPVPRPEPAIEVLSRVGAISVPAQAAVAASPRPVGRLTEDVRQRRAMMRALRVPRPVIDTAGLVERSARPSLRDATLIPAAASRPRQGASGGGICGRPSIRGEAIPPVSGPGQCGIPQAVQVRSVSGVQLSLAARMDCATAAALDDWVRGGLLPVMRERGGGAVGLRVAAGYACRGRNNQAGGRVSEHGKGRAIDISGILLANGSEVTVLTGWNSSDGALLRELWRRACGPFGTVLGPDSDRFHADHFHFDTARYRSGSYCR
ncbi:extensin family protein [Jannaschia formosa]|nr:extensin family protein [Jannaschia formosa]